VIEPTLGIDRAFLAFVCDALQIYPNGRKQDTQAVEEIVDENKAQGEETVLHIHPQLAPITIAVLPLSKKEELSGPAKEIAQKLREEYMVEYDETGSIGKRYRRQDEIGTPFCVTFDFDSLEDKKVTVRNRDTMKQDRVEVSDLSNYIQEKLTNW
jgi:glycyl-tRNA synthetase